MIRSTLVALACVLLAVAARASILPPPGFDTFILHQASHGTATGELGSLAGAEGSLPIEERVHPNWVSSGYSAIGGGTASANELTGYLYGNGDFHFLYTSVRDTYTVSGPAGPVEIVARFTAEAHKKRVPIGAAPHIIHGSGGISIRIGTGISSDGISISNILASDGDSIPNGTGPLEKDLFAEVESPLTVTANQPFPLAFGMTLSGTGETDAMNTAAIDFTLPEGYAITSELGWGSVPEPSPGMLALLGIGTVVGLVTCRGVRVPRKAPVAHKKEA